jgi:adenosylhomocysteine nucleosidase
VGVGALSQPHQHQQPVSQIRNVTGRMQRTGGQRPVMMVSGMVRESRIARGPGVITLCGDAKHLASHFAAQSGRELDAVISFGIAGGLEPSLNPGDVVVASRVVSGAHTWYSHVGLLSLLTERLRKDAIEARQGIIVGVDKPTMTPAEKDMWRRATGADAVDTESHLAADYALANDLPFCALRVISDPASRALPPLALNALKPDGHINVAAVIASLLRNPAQIGGLAATQRDASAGFSVLRRCRGVFDFGAPLGLMHL